MEALFEWRDRNMDNTRKEVGEIIDCLAVIFDEKDVENTEIKKEIENLESRLKKLTGKTIEECEPFRNYWSYTSLEDIVDRIMMPPSTNLSELSDGELRDKLNKLFDEIATMKPSKLDRTILELEAETGIDNVSDYIFWPEMIEGLGKHAEQEAIINRILADRKR